MKNGLVNFFRIFGLYVSRFDENRYRSRRDYFRHREIHKKYAAHTMIPFLIYSDNLKLAAQAGKISGDIVECGVWRGGMIAGIAEVLGRDRLGRDRKYWLFDSFEGLPPAGEADGEAARNWQNNKTGEHYYDNCAAEQGFAAEAIKMSGAQNYELVKGWFSDTLQKTAVNNIALLRLDGDWYDSTMTCLEALYPKVADGGVIIIDDYYFWEGCTRAVHDYLSRHALSERIRETANGVAYIIKNQKINHF
jgi:O-methyltransferase